MKIPKQQQGFTLIEALVVLVISSFTVGLLMNAYHQIMQIQQRFGVERAYAEQGAMISDWVRQIIQGLHPDYPNGPAIFKGESTEMTGQTTAPPNAQYGTSEIFSMKIVHDKNSNRSELRYKPLPDGAEIALISWSGRSGQFQYYNDAGTAFDSWPSGLENQPQLPSGISVRIMREHAPWVIFSAPRADHETPKRLRDFTGQVIY